MTDLLIASVVLMMLIVSVVMIARRLHRDKPAVTGIARNVERLDAHEKYGGKLHERVSALEDELARVREQLAAERKARAVLTAAVLAAFDAGGREAPADLMTTLPLPALRLVKGSGA